jgi:hypothetical protein
VAESGIFLKDTTFEPMFHRSGEPVGTFYSMIAGGVPDTLQTSYDAGNAITLSGVSGDLNFTVPQAAGVDFLVEDDLNQRFLETDSAASRLDFGDAAITLRFVGQLSSGITFDGVGAYLIQNTNDLDLIASTNLNLEGNSGIRFTSSGGNILYDSPNASAFNVQLSTINASTNANGILQLAYDAGVTSSFCSTATVTNALPTLEIGAWKGTVTNNGTLTDTQEIYGYYSTLTQNGNGAPTGIAWGIDFYAGPASFTGGSGAYASVGLYVDSSHDWGVISYTGGNNFRWGALNGTQLTFFNMGAVAGGITSTSGLLRHSCTFGLANSRGVWSYNDIESIGGGGDQLGGTFHKIESTSRVGSGSNPLLNTGELVSLEIFNETDTNDASAPLVDCIHYGLKLSMDFENAGGTNDGGSSARGIYIDLPETLDGGGVYHTNDGTYMYSRWAIMVNSGESRFRRTSFRGPTNLGKSLIDLYQRDVVEEFISFTGTSGGVTMPPPNHISTFDGASAVLSGPHRATPQSGFYGWLFDSMVKIEINGAEKWIACYELEAIP